MNQQYFSPVSSREDFSLAEGALYSLLSQPETLPISYTLGEKHYYGLPSDSLCEKEEASDKTLLRYTATIEGILLTAECVLHHQFGAVEWKLTAKNISSQAVHLCDFNGADMDFAGTNARILTCNGDFCSPDGYAITETTLPEGAKLEQAPEGGRACSGAFPYQRLLFDDFGYHIAIGWSGQWQSTYYGTANGVHFTAKQQYFDIMLPPDVTVRSPLMVVVAFVGGLERGVNVWRRFYLAQVIPHSKGKIIPPFLHSHKKVPGTMEWQESTEKEQLDGLAELQKLNLPVNLWWIDAGWYDCGEGNWWTHAGKWTPDYKRFPNGLAPVGKQCEKQGIHLLVWFEPERITQRMADDLGFEQDHPDWLLKIHKDNPVFTHYPALRPEENDERILMNLTNPSCREYLTKKIGDTIEQSHISVYRQDFNLPPLDNWLSHDKEDSVGLTENLYIQSYLCYWDSLRERFPDLIIDSCASGGRRNDIETMRRAVPFHETDSSYGNHPVQLSFYQTLYSWIPYFRGFNAGWETEDGSYATPSYYNKLETPVDTFQLYSTFAPIWAVSHCIDHIVNHPEQKEKQVIVQKACNDFVRISPLLETADFYPLTPYHKNRFHWNVFQFDKPEWHKGCIQVIRHNAAEQEELRVYPIVSGKGMYQFTDCVTGKQFRLSSIELAEKGLSLKMPKRSATFLEYEIISEHAPLKKPFFNDKYVPSFVAPSGELVERQIIREGYDRKKCMVHARGAFDGKNIVMTAQYTDLHGCDIFDGLLGTVSHDGGNSFEYFHGEASLQYFDAEKNIRIACADMSPYYHKKSGKIIITGVEGWYNPDNSRSKLQKSFFVPYAIWNEKSERFGELQHLTIENNDRFISGSAGCAQIYEDDNGDLLIPVYHVSAEKKGSISVLRCAFDGEALSVKSVGNDLTYPGGGIGEASVIGLGGKYYLTVRSPYVGLVASSEDGTHFSPLQPWKWADGTTLPTYNTQTHWMKLGNDLYLVYTRMGCSNDHVFRHRAPLLAAKVDKETLRVRPETEFIAVPERGARLGNFGICQASNREALIFAAEWMFPASCEEFGSNNAIWMTRVTSADASDS